MAREVGQLLVRVSGGHVMNASRPFPPLAAAGRRLQAGWRAIFGAAAAALAARRNRQALRDQS